MTRAIDKMVEKLEDETKEIPECREDRAFQSGLFHALDMARSLAADEAKPTADKGLVEAIENWFDEHDKNNNWPDFWGCESGITEILSRYHPAPKEESLAELAYRKGFHNTSIWGYVNGGYEINLRYWKGPKTWEVFTAPTYPEAEAKARKWLMERGEK